MFRLELRQKKRIFWIFTAIFIALQLMNILGRPMISQITRSQMEVMSENPDISIVPPQMTQMILQVMEDGDKAYFAGQWLIQNFVPVLIFVVLILGAGSFIRQREEKTHFFALNFVSRETFLHHSMAASFLVIAGWLMISFILSAILILSLHWDINLWVVLGFYALTGLRVMVMYEFMVLISLFFTRRGPVYAIAVLLGLLLTMVIQFISPFGKFSWISGGAIFFRPPSVIFELASLIPQFLGFYLLIRRKWLTMEI